jgi:L-lactate utilization protein LutB
MPENAPEDIYAKRLANKESTKTWYLQQSGQRVVEALQRNGFGAMYIPSRAQAKEEVLKLVPNGTTIGTGGSMTLRELGITQHLAEKGHTMYDHWKPGLSADEVLAVRRAQLTCDVFLTSVNAITSDGELVSTDGIGNRVAATIFGPKKVIIVAGVNKIVKDVQAALRRTKEVAAPLSLKETGMPIPCVQSGICADCSSPLRMCRATMILERKPFNSDITVLIVGEDLGF